MIYKDAFFDLDGTLTDPAEGITNSVAYALAKFGIIVEDHSVLNNFIGPPLWDSFEEYYGFSRSDSELAVTYFREYFSDRGIYENYLFDGVAEMLGNLLSSGIRLSLATSKPTEFAERIIRRFELTDFFSAIVGSEMNGERVKKGDVIACALERNGIINPAEAIMIGDRKHDIIGAHEQGTASMGVLYGYGSREELTLAGADMLAGSLEDISEMLL